MLRWFKKVTTYSFLAAFGVFIVASFMTVFMGHQVEGNFGYIQRVLMTGAASPYVDNDGTLPPLPADGRSFAPAPESATPLGLGPAVQANNSGQKCEDYRGIVSQYDWNVETVLMVMWFESACQPGVTGDEHLANDSCGLLQIHLLPERGFGQFCSDPRAQILKDPAFNIEYAYGLWQTQGYCGAWYTSWTRADKMNRSCPNNEHLNR